MEGFFLDYSEILQDVGREVWLVLAVQVLYHNRQIFEYLVYY
jgi:hypothetical protein